MIEAIDVVNKAREYIGTPWHHGAMVKGVGIDCSGLVVCVFRELGCDIETPRNYGRSDEWVKMELAVADHCDEIGELEPRNGDIFMFRFRQMTNHCGIYCRDTNTLIHSYQSVGAVVEHELDRSWGMRLARVYRHRELSTWQL